MTLKTRNHTGKLIFQGCENRAASVLRIEEKEREGASEGGKLGEMERKSPGKEEARERGGD